MLARSIYLGAALLLAASLLGIRAGTRQVAHYAVTLPGVIPAVVYEPGPTRGFGEPPPTDRRYPVVVLAHGFAANRVAMGVLAGRLARAGYAVVTFDFRGHGMNPNRLGTGRSADALFEDLDVAVRYATTQPHFDSERLILAGHSMGAGAVLGYASREPGAAAVVAISGGLRPDGPYEVPNALLIWASRDPRRIRVHLREVAAHLAGLQRLVLDRLYGDPARGTAVRMTEVDGTDHLTILYSREAADRIVRWLDEAVGPPTPERTPSRGDPRLPWSGLGMLSCLVLLFGAMELVASGRSGASVSARSPCRPWVALLELLGAHVAAVVVLAGFDSEAGGGSLGLLPVRAGEEMASFFLLSGIALLFLLGIRGASLPRALPHGGALLCGGSIAVAGYLLLASVVSSLWDLRVLPHRLPLVLFAALFSLPFFLATEWRLRGEGIPRWVSPLGKGVTLLVIGIGAASGLLPFVVLLGTAGLIFLFVLYEVVGIRLAGPGSDPWPAALTQALWTGWFLGGIFPLST